MLFHAGVSGLSGGFAGVDIFFVISGYRITSLILKDIGRGRFSFWKSPGVSSRRDRPPQCQPEAEPHLSARIPLSGRHLQVPPEYRDGCGWRACAPRTCQEPPATEEGSFPALPRRTVNASETSL